MLKHYLIITYRSLLRHKSSFLINLIGLSTGLACVLLIYLWVDDELSIDQFFENDRRLYQVMNNLAFSQDIETEGVTPVPLAAALVNEMPEVEYAVSVNDFSTWGSQEGILSNGQKHIKARGAHASKDYFHVFSYELIQGDKDQVLTDPLGVVLSDKMAHKLFQTTDDVVGKPLEWQHPDFEGPFYVSGIFAAPPSNANVQFDVIFHIDVLLENDRWAREWTGCYAQTYLLLQEGTNLEQFNAKIADFQKSKDERLGVFTLFAQKYSSRYLFDQYENGRQAGGRITYVRLFSLLALFILLIACINFMNLSTARASLKVKEIGVKKTVGATRKSLIIQFLSESMVATFLASQIALIWVTLLLPQVNELTGKQLTLKLSVDQFLVMTGIVLFTGLLAGSYPAFYLSGFKPMTVLKGKLNKSTGVLWVRKGLVVFQFAISVLFITGLLVMNEQIKYTQTKNLGYDRDNVLSFHWKGDLFNHREVSDEGKSNEQFETFMQELNNLPGVVIASSMDGSIIDRVYGQSGISWSGHEAERDFLFQSPVVGPKVIELLGIELAAGRTFSLARGDDYSKVILNEAAAKMMGMNDPIGETFPWNNGVEIIGVVKDFHYGSLHNSVEPLFFRFVPRGRDILVRIQAGTEKTTLERMQDLHQQFLPRYPFEFTFMDQDYQAMYESDNQVATLSNYLACIAIIISCLGLFGLAAFSAERRVKEIGIRRIIGASIWNIMKMLSTEFTKMVAVAIVIALPLSYLVFKRWLDGFAYKIELQWWFFVGAAVITLLIAWLTIGFQTFKVASVNPVEHLRDE